MSDLDRRVIRELTFRLVPLYCALSFVASLDRVNVSFAALRMNHDIGLTPQMFGFGAGLFFVPYALCAIPANWMLERIGARLWIASMMIAWGVVSAGMAFVKGGTSFYVFRFLLGVAESGFNPAALYLFGVWFPSRYRSAAVAQFHWAQIGAIAVGAPLSGALLSFDGFLGLSGWQAMFVLEGFPAVILALVVLTYLDDGPRDAAWLSPEKKHWLLASLSANEEQRKKSGSIGSFKEAITSLRVWTLILFYSAVATGYYGMALWLPQIIKSLSNLGGMPLSDFGVTAASSIPYLFGAIAVFAVGRFADRTGLRRMSLVTCMLVATAGSMISVIARDPIRIYIGLCISAIGVWGTLGVFWTVATELLHGMAAAKGVAMISGVSNLIASFPVPYAIGLIRARSGGFTAALAAIGVVQLLGAVLALLLPRHSTDEIAVKEPKDVIA